MHLMLAALLTIHAMVLQSPQTYALKRFEVIRVNGDEMGRVPAGMRFIFSDPVPDGERVANLQEAEKRVGFSPRMIKGKTPTRLFVTNPVNEEAKISVAALTSALRDANVNVTVPSNWDGVVIRLQQQPGILVDYGDFYIAQAAPTTLSAPAGFPLPQLMEMLFRVMGTSESQARTMRENFAANASAYVPIGRRFDMDIRQVPMLSGSGLLLQNADKGGELAFMWSTGDRSYFLTGLLPEEQTIATANSLQ